MVVSDAGGWLNGDVAAGCAVGVGVGVCVGGCGVALGPGAAGALRRAGLARGASTVTCGIETAGAGAVCGASGVACGVAGVVCGACGAGVSDPGGVVVGAVSGVAGGVCDDATPATQSSTSAELLRRNKRLKWIDITIPLILNGYAPLPPTVERITAKQRRTRYRRCRR